MVAEPTLYDLFGVAADASPEEVRGAYLRQIRRHHPDRAEPHLRAAAEQRTKQLTEAWAVLGDPIRRRAYDQDLATPTTPPEGDDVLDDEIVDEWGSEDILDDWGTPAPPQPPQPTPPQPAPSPFQVPPSPIPTNQTPPGGQMPPGFSWPPGFPQPAPAGDGASQQFQSSTWQMPTGWPPAPGQVAPVPAGRGAGGRWRVPDRSLLWPGGQGGWVIAARILTVVVAVLVLVLPVAQVVAMMLGKMTLMGVVSNLPFDALFVWLGLWPVWARAMGGPITRRYWMFAGLFLAIPIIGLVWTIGFNWAIATIPAVAGLLVATAEARHRALRQG